MESTRDAEIIKLLDKLEILIEDSKTSFLSSKITVDKTELTDIISDIRIKLPTELSNAVWIVDERKKILEEAEGQAQCIIEDAKEQAKMLIEKSEITQFAKERASCIVENAKMNSKEIQKGSIEYAQDMCAHMEKKLKNTLDMVHAEAQNFEANITEMLREAFDNRQELKDMLVKLEEEPE